MKIKHLEISFRGWPWQKVESHWASTLDKTAGNVYGWNPFSVKGMGRFGGGWAIKFGITISHSLKDIILDCGIGSVRFIYRQPKNNLPPSKK